MRKLMAAVLVVSGLGLVTGCERKSDLQRQREDVAEAQRDVKQEQQKADQELAEGRQDAQKDLSKAQRDLADEQSELAAKEYDQLSDHGATGGSGLANDSTARDPIASDTVHDTGKLRDEAAQEIQGTIQSASGSNLTLIVPDQDNKLVRFKSDKQVQVMRDDKAMSLSRGTSRPEMMSRTCSAAAEAVAST